MLLTLKEDNSTCSFLPCHLLYMLSIICVCICTRVYLYICMVCTHGMTVNMFCVLLFDCLLSVLCICVDIIIISSTFVIVLQGTLFNVKFFQALYNYTIQGFVEWFI